MYEEGTLALRRAIRKLLDSGNDPQRICEDIRDLLDAYDKLGSDS